MWSIWKRKRRDGSQTPGPRQAAIVCEHVAAGNMPILRVVRDEPQDPADSGWQCLCDCGEDENIERAQVWAVEEVLRREPSLNPHFSLPAGSCVVRRGLEAEWIRIR